MLRKTQKSLKYLSYLLCVEILMHHVIIKIKVGVLSFTLACKCHFSNLFIFIFNKSLQLSSIYFILNIVNMHTHSGRQIVFFGQKLLHFCQFSFGLYGKRWKFAWSLYYFLSRHYKSIESFLIHNYNI